MDQKDGGKLEKTRTRLKKSCDVSLTHVLLRLLFLDLTKKCSKCLGKS